MYEKNDSQTCHHHLECPSSDQRFRIRTLLPWWEGARFKHDYPRGRIWRNWISLFTWGRIRTNGDREWTLWKYTCDRIVYCHSQPRIFFQSLYPDWNCENTILDGIYIIISLRIVDFWRSLYPLSQAGFPSIRFQLPWHCTGRKTLPDGLQYHLSYYSSL